MRRQLTKIVFMATLVLASAFNAFAADIPGYCKGEITALSKGSGFSMQNFISDLPSAVVKAKAQAKLPFGKPKDSDKTDIGLTFGCLKAFPESPSEIQSLLKDVSTEIAKDAVANQLYENVQEVSQMQPQPVQPQVQPQYQYQPQPAQPQYIYVQAPVAPSAQQPQQAQCRVEYFTAGERWGTWALNMLIPGLGSAVIMHDYAGMGIQMGLTALGVIFIVALGEEEESYGGGMYCNSNGCYPSGYNYGTRETEFLPIGIGLLAVNFIFNIARSNSYNEPPNNYASNERNGFNLAVLPSRRGEIMPYLMYNKTF